ncbi:MAG: DNA-directed RNA polymerase subunit A'' [Candidatus Aenigmarchaeota archaeon]|nr:DNA-directed RNA polymerase subunit A'' [Candidatus Aenigmarchaeota archaeon]
MQDGISRKALEAFEKWCEEKGISGSKKEAALKRFHEIVAETKYEPGESIGVVAAQSISEPATQMSCSPHEKIILKKEGKVGVVEIGKFTDSIVEKVGDNIDGWGVCDISSEGIYVPSITDKEKIGWRLVKACSRHKSPENMLRLTTFSGRQIVATPSHSFVIRKNNQIVPIAGSGLSVGDRIPVMKFLPENCISEIKVADHMNSRLLHEKSGLLYTTKQSKPMPNRMNLDFLFGWFIGAYLSEGNAERSHIGISNIDEKFVSNVKAFAGKIGMDFVDRIYDGEFGPGRTIRINSSLLSNFIISTCGKGSNNKKVPLFAYSAKEGFISGLLRGYFDGDGNVSVKRKMIRASSNSKELLDGICILLARFGIFAYKVDAKTKVTTQHGLIIPYKYAPAFLEKIGSDIPKKKKRLELLSGLSKIFWDEKSQDFTDVIGGFGDLFYNTARKLGYPTRYTNSFTKRQKIGRTVLGRHIKLFEKLSAEKGIDITPELGIMKTMLNSDIVWDEIAGIESIVPDFDYVYDLTVEGTETFTTFDGIITHNTMRSYTLATQRDRLSKVTQGLPRLIEIFDARKTFEKNMRIYLKREHNDKETAAALAEKIKMRTISDTIKSDSLDVTNMRIELELQNAGDADKIKEVFAKSKLDVSIRADKIFMQPKKGDLRLLRRWRNKVLSTQISGIKGIKAVVVSKDGEDWFLQTSGTNLKKIMQVEEVDPARIFTNDVYQVYEVLGIEAARQSILEDAKNALDEQGLEVDVRHLLLLADIMTLDGTVKSIGRYGISGSKASVLARANFEETKKHVVNASFYGEEDRLQGVVENVLIGGIVPIGTGMVKIGIDLNKLMGAKKG